MPLIQENVQMILDHLKSRKGWKMRDVAEQAFFLSADERERFYRWMMRARAGKIAERHGASAVHERTLRWLIHAEESLFEVAPDLIKFDLIEEVCRQSQRKALGMVLAIAKMGDAYLYLNEDSKEEFLRRVGSLVKVLKKREKDGRMRQHLKNRSATDTAPIAFFDGFMSDKQREMYEEILGAFFVKPLSLAQRERLKRLVVSHGISWGREEDKREIAAYLVAEYPGEVETWETI